MHLAFLYMVFGAAGAAQAPEIDASRPAPKPYLTVHSTVQYCTVHYSTLHVSTVQYSIVQYCTVQYSIRDASRGGVSNSGGCWGFRSLPRRLPQRLPETLAFNTTPPRGDSYLWGLTSPNLGPGSIENTAQTQRKSVGGGGPVGRNCR